MNEPSSWAENEFSNIDFGDKRLNNRLVKLCDSFSDSPECSINQACSGWAETKAAYRFFANEKIDYKEIIRVHSAKSAGRAQKHPTVLAIQDTSYMIYTNHLATKGLGNISVKEGKNIKQIYSKGLVSHSCLAVTTDGLPLGILDQNTFSRELNSDEARRNKNVTPIEEKESFRWLEMLRNSSSTLPNTQVVTVCDREADMYEFFKLSDDIGSPVVVRAKVNRAVNKKSRYAEKNVSKLWDFVGRMRCTGTFTIKVPAKKNKRNNIKQESRVAKLGVKYGEFFLSPPRNNVKHRTETLPDLKMYAVYAYEISPPRGIKPLEWMLLTNLPVASFAEASEKIKWYCLRWRIETYFKVLKSGLKIEECRLGDANRLVKFIAVMSVVAWKLFMLTLAARTDPETPCNTLLDDEQWKVLYLETHKTKSLPKKVPMIGSVVRWIAMLGGFLGRMNDGDPGITTLWRGWKRLVDISRGWNLALRHLTYG